MTEASRLESIEAPARDRELTGFIAALRHVWAKSGMALALGIILTWLNVKYLDTHKVAGPILQHLGLAFIVCAIAIFGYEWHSHQRQIEALARKLSDSIGKAAEMQKLLADYNIDLFKQQLPNLLVAERGATLLEPITELVTKAEELPNAPRWREKFIAKLLRDVVLKNVEEIRSLGQNTGEYHPGITMTEVAAADFILTEQMGELMDGDKYDVISDMQSWKERQLDEFHETSKKAAKDGKVFVRRIFNLLEEDLENPENAKDAVKILEDHLGESNNSDGHYQVRVLHKKWMDEPSLKEQLGAQKLKKLHADHFCIFTCNNFNHKGKMLRVEVRPNFALHMATEPFYIDEYRERFEAAWAAIPPLDKTIIEELKKRISAPLLLMSK